MTYSITVTAVNINDVFCGIYLCLMWIANETRGYLLLRKEDGDQALHVF